MSTTNPTLAHFRHFSHFRHSCNYNIFPDTLNYAKQTQLTNCPNRRKLIYNNELCKYYQSDESQKQSQNKPKQTQLLQRAKLMQSLYVQRIMKNNANIGTKKQSQFKANSNPITERAKMMEFIQSLSPGAAYLAHNRGMLAHLLWSLPSGVLTRFSAGGRGLLRG
jgi:CRISPR/Cas system-associated protein Csx1